MKRPWKDLAGLETFEAFQKMVAVTVSKYFFPGNFKHTYILIFF